MNKDGNLFVNVFAALLVYFLSKAVSKIVLDQQVRISDGFVLIVPLLGFLIAFEIGKKIPLGRNAERELISKLVKDDISILNKLSFCIAAIPLIFFVLDFISFSFDGKLIGAIYDIGIVLLNISLIRP